MKDKTILIQGAMDIEVEYLIRNLERKEKHTIAGYEFYTGYIHTAKIIICQEKTPHLFPSAEKIYLVSIMKIFIINTINKFFDALMVEKYLFRKRLPLLLTCFA